MYAVWGVALVATLASLFFSEVMKLPPCVLCWYQRIAMYPLVVLFPVALVNGEVKSFARSAMALSVIGMLISIYHNLLYYGLIPESITPCTQGVSCTSRQIEWMGFVTIPLLALVAFVLIVVLLSVDKWRSLKA